MRFGKRRTSSRGFYYQRIVCHNCQGGFHPNMTTLRPGLCYPNSVCLSSVCLSVTFVHPTQVVETFGNISSPLCTLPTVWPQCKILRRSSQENPSVGGVKRKRGSKIQRSILDLSKTISHERYKIRPRVQLMTNRKWHLMNSVPPLAPTAPSKVYDAGILLKLDASAHACFVYFD